MTISVRTVAAWAVELPVADLKTVPGDLGEAFEMDGYLETLTDLCGEYGASWAPTVGGNFVTGKPPERFFLCLRRHSDLRSSFAQQEGDCRSVEEVFGTIPQPTPEECEAFAKLQDRLGFTLQPLKPWIITSGW